MLQGSIEVISGGLVFSPAGSIGTDPYERYSAQVNVKTERKTPRRKITFSHLVIHFPALTPIARSLSDHVYFTCLTCDTFGGLERVRLVDLWFCRLSVTDLSTNLGS